MANSPLQFGDVEPGLIYQPRTGVYGILERDGLIACVRVGYSDYKYDLPGGAVDPGETHTQAVEREYLEETGLIVKAGRPVADVLQYFINKDGTPYNNHSYVCEVTLEGENLAAKCEPDHELVWLNPLQVLTNLEKEGYCWAVVQWLRGRG